MAITKKTSTAPAKKITKPVAKKTTTPAKTLKPIVVAKTTKPKVIVETKTIRALPTESLSTGCSTTGGCCGGKCKGVGKVVVKLVFALLTIANFVLLCVALSSLKSQQNFTLLSNGGAENYAALKEIYATPEYQSIATSEIYKMVDNITQTIAAAQSADQNTVAPIQ